MPVIPRTVDFLLYVRFCTLRCKPIICFTGIADCLGCPGAIIAARHLSIVDKTIPTGVVYFFTVRCRLAVTERIADDGSVTYDRQRAVTYVQHCNYNNYVYFYTTVSQKGSHLMFDNNFCKCGLIFKIISPSDSRKRQRQRLPPHLWYVVTPPCESRKSKNVTDFDIGPKIVCFLTQSVQLTLSSVQLTLLECVMWSS